MDRAAVQVFAGLALAMLASALVVVTDALIAASITLLILGIVLVANARRKRTAREG